MTVGILGMGVVLGGYNLFQLNENVHIPKILKAWHATKFKFVYPNLKMITLILLCDWSICSMVLPEGNLKICNEVSILANMTLLKWGSTNLDYMLINYVKLTIRKLEILQNY